MYKLRGIFFLMVAAILYGFMPIWVKLAYGTGLNAYDVTLLRSGIAAALLGVFIRYRKISFKVDRPQLIPLLLSGTGYTATILTLYLSYNYVSAGVATSLHYIYPVLVMLWAFFIYHEKLQSSKWIALLASLTGIYLIASIGESSFSLPGVSLAIISAFLFSYYILSINQQHLKRMNSLVLAFYACLIAAITILILVMVQGNWPPHLTLTGLFYTGLVGFFCTALALILFIKGVKIIGPANASILSTLEPVVSLIAGIILLHEPLTLHTSIGCAMIIAAVILIGYSDMHNHSQA